MRLRIFIVLAVISLCNAKPQRKLSEFSFEMSYANAVDLTGFVDMGTVNCYKANDVSVVFLQGYNGSGIPLSLSQSTSFAINGGLGVEMYITPNRAGLCYQQFDALYNSLKNDGFALRYAWLQVTNPAAWSTSTSSNIEFIRSCMQRALGQNVGFGVYTNVKDWEAITETWTKWTDIMPLMGLWYWHTNGVGSGRTSQPSFDDFVPFAGWSRPDAKQYGQGLFLCSGTVNYNVYPAQNAPQTPQKADDSTQEVQTPSTGHANSTKILPKDDESVGGRKLVGIGGIIRPASARKPS